MTGFNVRKKRSKPTAAQDQMVILRNGDKYQKLNPKIIQDSAWALRIIQGLKEEYEIKVQVGKKALDRQIVLRSSEEADLGKVTKTGAEIKEMQLRLAMQHLMLAGFQSLLENPVEARKLREIGRGYLSDYGLSAKQVQIRSERFDSSTIVHALIYERVNANKVALTDKVAVHGNHEY